MMSHISSTIKWHLRMLVSFIHVIAVFITILYMPTSVRDAHSFTLLFVLLKKCVCLLTEQVSLYWEHFLHVLVKPNTHVYYI